MSFNRLACALPAGLSGAAHRPCGSIPAVNDRRQPPLWGGWGCARFRNMVRVLPQQQRLELPSLHCSQPCLSGKRKLCHKAGGFLNGIVLPKRNKEVILAAQECADIWRAGRKPVIGGNRQYHRTVVTQMRLYCHCYRCIGDAAGELAQRVAGAGCHQQKIQSASVGQLALPAPPNAR